MAEHRERVVRQVVEAQSIAGDNIQRAQQRVKVFHDKQFKV